MRKIQMERKLFEIFNYKYLVYENFQDDDLNIDDQLIYKYDNEEQLVNIFAKNQFFSIWFDERRQNAGLICACEGNLNIIIDFIKGIGIKDENYSTSDCGLTGGPRVIYFTSQEAMSTFSNYLSVAMSNALTSSSSLITTSPRT